MRRSVLFLIALFNFILISGQSKILISKPELSYADNILIVKYDITGCRTGQSIDISLKIISSKGDTIKPSNISGDIGPGVNCGMGKMVQWNVVKDNIRIDDDIEVMLSGKEIIPVASGINYPVVKRTTRGKVIASSFFVPGLGQEMASGKGGYLLFSGLVYGVAGASAYFFVMDKKYYTDYKNTSGAEADGYFSKSEKSYNMGRYLLFGAAGAWVTNFIWSAVIPIKSKSAAIPGVGIITTPNRNLMLSAKWTF
jgi:hypothetical protein